MGPPMGRLRPKRKRQNRQNYARIRVYAYNFIRVYAYLLRVFTTRIQYAYLVRVFPIRVYAHEIILNKKNRARLTILREKNRGSQSRPQKPIPARHISYRLSFSNIKIFCGFAFRKFINYFRFFKSLRMVYRRKYTRK